MSDALGANQAFVKNLLIHTGGQWCTLKWFAIAFHLRSTDGNENMPLAELIEAIEGAEVDDSAIKAHREAARRVLISLPPKWDGIEVERMSTQGRPYRARLRTPAPVPEGQPAQQAFLLRRSGEQLHLHVGQGNVRETQQLLDRLARHLRLPATDVMRLACTVLAEMTGLPSSDRDVARTWLDAVRKAGQGEADLDVSLEQALRRRYVRSPAARPRPSQPQRLRPPQ